MVWTAEQEGSLCARRGMEARCEEGMCVGLEGCGRCVCWRGSIHSMRWIVDGTWHLAHRTVRWIIDVNSIGTSNDRMNHRCDIACFIEACWSRPLLRPCDGPLTLCVVRVHRSMCRRTTISMNVESYALVRAPRVLHARMCSSHIPRSSQWICTVERINRRQYVGTYSDGTRKLRTECTVMRICL